MAITEKYASSAGAGAKDGTSEGAAWDFATMLTTATAGDRVNFKGNHTLTGNASFTNPGTVTSPLIVRGYASSIGDCSALGRTNGNGALVTTGMPVINNDQYQLTMPAYSIVEALVFSTSARSLGQAVALSNFGGMLRCSVSNTNTGASAAGLDCNGTHSFLVDCDITKGGASGGTWALRMSSINWAIGCRIDGGPAVGVSLSSVGTLVNCTIIGGTDCVIVNNTSNPVVLVNCTLVGGSSDGVHVVTGNTRNPVIVNCLITDNGAYALYGVDAASAMFAVGNRIDRNTSGVSSGATDWLAAFAGLNNTTSATQANEYEAAASDDYRLKSTSPALSIGIPLYADLGALQQQPAASSGGASGGRKGPLGMWKIG